jgi:hypothetical protein
VTCIPFLDWVIRLLSSRGSVAGVLASLGREDGIWLKIQLWFIRCAGLRAQAALTGRCVGLEGGD